MLSSTRSAIRAILTADPSLNPAARFAALAALDGKPAPAASASPAARILRRGEVAKRFMVSVRAVDQWAASGILNKVRLPGRARASGFRESDVSALIEARPAGEARHV